MTQENNQDDPSEIPVDTIPWPENDQMNESDTSTPEKTDINDNWTERD